MSAILEKAIEKVRALPAEQQQRLRELAAGLDEATVIAVLYILFHEEGISMSESDLTKQLWLLKRVDVNQPWSKETAPVPVSDSTALSSRIRGKYAHIRTSSEALAQLKQEEIKLEDHRG